MSSDFKEVAFEVSKVNQPADVGFLTENIPSEVNSFFEKSDFQPPDCSSIYGLFKNRNKNINGVIIHNFKYTDEELIVLKKAPSGPAVVESIGCECECEECWWLDTARYGH